MKKIKLLIFFLIITSYGVYSQNEEDKWGYFLQIVDANYIPQIENIDGSRYINLHTGISDYDAIFAKYKITEFYQYVPTIETEWLRQIYFLVCDSGQVELGKELNAKYSDVIPYIENIYLTPRLTGENIAKVKNDEMIVIQSNGKIKLIGFSNLAKKVNFFSLKGELLYSINTNDDIIDHNNYLSKGMFVYEIIVGSIRKVGLISY